MRIYRFNDLYRLGIVRSRVTLTRWVKSGLLPPPIQLGPNSIGFDADKVDKMIAARPQKQIGDKAA